METILAYGFISILVSAVVQAIKKNTAHNPLIILAVMSIIAATVYTLMAQTIYFDAIVQTCLMVAATSNLVYNLLKPFFKNA